MAPSKAAQCDVCHKELRSSSLPRHMAVLHNIIWSSKKKLAPTEAVAPTGSPRSPDSGALPGASAKSKKKSANTPDNGIKKKYRYVKNTDRAPVVCTLNAGEIISFGGRRYVVENDIKCGTLTEALPALSQVMPCTVVTTSTQTIATKFPEVQAPVLPTFNINVHLHGMGNESTTMTPTIAISKNDEVPAASDQALPITLENQENYINTPPAQLLPFSQIPGVRGHNISQVGSEPNPTLMAKSTNESHLNNLPTGGYRRQGVRLATHGPRPQAARGSTWHVSQNTPQFKVDQPDQLNGLVTGVPSSVPAGQVTQHWQFESVMSE